MNNTLKIGGRLRCCWMLEVMARVGGGTAAFIEGTMPVIYKKKIFLSA